ALIYAGTDTLQGVVQRIFYFHMPSFFGAFTAFIATVIGGVQYLRTRNPKWDTLALAGVEVGLALSLVNLATGSIWARPIWNTWWTWDPRLTSAAIMALTYAAYLMLRNGIENPEQRRRFAAIFGILAITTVIATLLIIRIRPDTIHPAVIGASPQNAQGTFELAATPGVTAALLTNLPIWALLVPITLMWWRIRLQNLTDRVEALKMAVLDR
ncbi:MAG: cytochrome c biogenesis protein CcsA, partial [Burkholderiales bacterium]|nr:cytochrome c biogenesis protein CcsA [Anaerolineae bacterium]